MHHDDERRQRRPAGGARAAQRAGRRHLAPGAAWAPAPRAVSNRMSGSAGTQTEPRTLAPPERRVASVVANEELGAYRLIAAEDSDGPADPRPGQFYMLASADRWGGEDGR